MNPTAQIGRYMLPLLNVVGMQRCPEWRIKFIEWLNRRFRLSLRVNVYDVTLINNHVIQFTVEEKQQYDEAMEWHSVTLQVYGAARGLGLRT